MRTRPRRSASLWVTSALMIACVLLGVIGAVAGERFLDGERRPAAERPPSPAVGVFRGTDRAAVEDFESWLGRPLDVVVDYSARDTWDQIADPDYMLREWSGSGLRPVYAVAMLPVSDQSATVAQGADGAYDEHFRRLAENLVEAGQGDAILRLGWEFNLEGSRWSTPEDEEFVQYWQRIVRAMRSVEGQSFRFDWNVNNGDGNRYDAVAYYPGDEFVDFIGVDVYDQSGKAGTYPYPDPCDDVCRQERQQRAWDEQIYGGDRGLRFWRDFARDKGKQLSLPEWGLWSRPDGTGGGSNPFFLERMHDFISDPANDVGYHAYFEVDGEDGEHTLREAFPAAGQVFRYLWGR